VLDVELVKVLGNEKRLQVLEWHSSNGTRTCDYSGRDEPLNLTAPANVAPTTAIPK
jgi:hypothetical protein